MSPARYHLLLMHQQKALTLLTDLNAFRVQNLNRRYQCLKFFQNKFPGKILYAVKTNPHKEVLKTIIQSGIKHFDVASIEEIKAIKKLDSNLHCSYMHTVKSRNNITSTKFNSLIKERSTLTS